MRVLFDYSAFVMQSRGGVSRVLFEAFQLCYNWMVWNAACCWIS